MMHLRLLFTVFLVGITATVWAKSPIEPAVPETPPTSDAFNNVAEGIRIGNGHIGVDTKGRIRINTPTGQVTVQPDSNAILGSGPTDIYLDPRLINTSARPVFGANQPINPFLDPASSLYNRNSELLNRLGTYFSTASGGFGFRIAFDRRLSPNTRLALGPEFLTYSLHRAARILGNDLPAQTTRITLFSLPIGLQRQFAVKSRLVPHIGFGVGPMVRFDHRAGLSGYYPSGYGYGTGFSARAGSAYDALGFTLPLFAGDYPKLSLTMGGHINSGLNIRFGSQKDLALTVEGRYTLARFFEAMGNPGDFSGLSLAIGFGKYF